MYVPKLLNRIKQYEHFLLCHTIFVVVLSVGEAPSVLEGLPDVSVLLGETAYMECKISGEPTPTIAWFRDQQEITDSKKYQLDYSDMVASIKIKEVTEKDAASITCEASNELGSVKTTGQLEIQGNCSFQAHCFIFTQYEVHFYHRTSVTVIHLSSLDNQFCYLSPD